MSDAGIAERDDAVARVGANANAEWKVAAMVAVRVAANRNATFTTDDVWDALSANTVGVSTQDNRALGPIMVMAAKSGVCRKTRTFPETRPSKRPELHRTPLQIWESLLFVRPVPTTTRIKPKRDTQTPDLFA